MERALGSIEQSLREDVGVCVAKAKAKVLRRSRQFKKILILYGGGGVCKHPYEQGVTAAFGHWQLTPEARALPEPPDLIWPRGVDGGALFKRFSVAYGLSFLRAVLDEHRFPEEIIPLQEPENEARSYEDRFVPKEQA
jgi:hypothetical protein